MRAPSRLLAYAALFHVVLGATCSPLFYAVRGRVVTCADKKPIADAHVHMRMTTNPTKEGRTKTEPDGTFSVSANTPPDQETATIEVSALGYKTAQTRVRSPEETPRICLEPQP